MTLREGFYGVSIAWLAVGAVWFAWLFRTATHLQTIDPEQWRVVDKGREEMEDEDSEEKFKYFYCF